MKSRILLLLLVIGTGPLVASETPPTEDAIPRPIKISTVPYVIAPLDKVVIKSPDDSVQSYQVSQDGLLNLGDKSFSAQGLTPEELTGLVRHHVSGAVSISIEEFRANRITVLGEVYHQIFTEMSDGPMRVLDAIASANGFTSLANSRRVKLVRENAGHVEVYELDLREVMKGLKSNQNMLIKAGDVITVPRNFL